MSNPGNYELLNCESGMHPFVIKESLARVAVYEIKKNENHRARNTE